MGSLSRFVRKQSSRTAGNRSFGLLYSAIRGLAALIVVLTHLRGMFFVQFALVTRHRALLHLLYVISGLGHMCVVIFFVLSGFLVGGTALRSLERQQWTWRGYLIQRFVRLWVVLIPALLVGAVLDRASLMRVAQHSTVQSALLLEDFGRHFDVPTLLGNLFFLQQIFVPWFGSNGPLWSLTNEFWYYLLFPLILCATGTQRQSFRISHRVLYGLAACLLAKTVGREILSLAPVWAFGALLHYAPRCRAKRWHRAVCAGVFPFLVAGLQSASYHVRFTDYVLGLATTALLWTLSSARGPACPERRYTRFSRALAGSSFTLYLVHKPLLTFAGCMLLGNELWMPDAKHLALGALLLSAVLLWARLQASVTELKTYEVRMRVERLISNDRLEAAWSRRGQLRSLFGMATQKLRPGRQWIGAGERPHG